MISPEDKQSFLLSSSTVFMFSIQTASTGPSNTYQRLSSSVAAVPARISVGNMPSVLDSARVQFRYIIVLSIVPYALTLVCVILRVAVIEMRVQDGLYFLFAFTRNNIFMMLSKLAVFFHAFSKLMLPSSLFNVNHRKNIQRINKASWTIRLLSQNEITKRWSTFACMHPSRQIR